MKKIIALALVALLALGLFGCAQPKAETYTVGICQLVQHEALDAATKGFKDALTEALGDKVTFDEQNAAGDSNTCATIVNNFVSKDVDLILANATASLQAAANATVTIPILGTAITEYGVALGLKDYTGTVGGNISGTSDLADLTAQAEMFNEWLPDAKTIGLLYCSAEPNSAYQVAKVKETLTAQGKTVQDYPFSDSNDLAAVCQTACQNCDALYIPTDNTAASSTGIIDSICRLAKVPIIAGEKDTCAGCGIASLTIDYYDLGYATGEMAVKVLKGEANISEMPVQYAPKMARVYNGRICADLGLTAPEGYTVIEGTEK